MSAVGQALLDVAGAAGLDAGLLARHGPALLKGAGMTLALVALSVPAGFVLAVGLAFARLEGGVATSGAASAFTGFFRGTPVLCQLYLIYYGSGQFHVALQAAGVWWMLRDAFWCAVFTFTLNTAAYQAEIIRGALRSLPAGQTEAARALGMTTASVYRLVLLPQALAMALRPLGNEVILMIKASSVASVVTVVELMGASKRAFADSVDFEIYLWAAALYLLSVEAVRRIWNALERRLAPSRGG